MRVVTTSPDATEIICAIGGGSLLAGVSVFCDEPPEVRTLPRVSTYTEASLIALAEIRPDLVVASTFAQHAIASAAAGAGYRVLVLQPTDLDSIRENVRLLGRVLDLRDGASALVRRLDEALARARARAAARPRRPRAAVEEWASPIVAAPPWVSEMVEAAGGDDVWKDLPHDPTPGSRTVEPEDLLARDPEVLFLAWAGTKDGGDPARVAARAGFECLAAVRTGRVHPLPPSLIGRPGPRLIDGLDRLASLIARAAEEGP